MSVEIALLGEVTTYVEGRSVDLGPARQRCVLAALAVDAGRLMPAERLIERVWGADTPRRGRATLHSYISRLRGAFAGAMTIVHRSSGYMLVVDQANQAVDVLRFRDLRDRTRDTDDDTHKVALLTEALTLWRGEPLTGLSGQWVESERERWQHERWAAEHDLVDAQLRTGHGEELVAQLSTRAAQHPLDERVAGQYMLALHRAGRSADALDHYRHLRKHLIEELGTDPGSALRNLQRQILAADPSLMPRPSRTTVEPVVVPRHLPAAPASFVGRRNELDRLDTTLRPGIEPAGATGAAVLISALGGAGGIGKTWLVLHWAHHNAHRFPDGQLFVDLRGFSPDSSPLTPSTAVRGFLTALGVDPGHIPTDLDAQAALYRSKVAGKRMLIVLDNAADSSQVEPLLPGTATCTVLVTSRKKLATLITRYGARQIQLGILTRQEAHALLTTRLDPARVDTEPEAANTLIRLCGHYPLALAIMTRQAHTRPTIPLAEFAAELRDLGLDALNSNDPTASLPAVLSWSLRGLTAKQRTVFALLGVAPGIDISLQAAASLTGLSPENAREALTVLEDASLLDRHAHGRYSMHDLIRDYATAQHLADDTREAALRRVTDFYAHTILSGLQFLAPARARQIRLEPPLPGTQPYSIPDAPTAMAWFNAEHHNLLADDLLQRVLATIGPRSSSGEVLLVALVSVLFRLTHDPEALTRQALAASSDPVRSEELRQLLAAIIYRGGYRGGRIDTRQKAILTLAESTVDDSLPDVWRLRRKSMLAFLRRNVTEFDRSEMDTEAEYAEAVRQGDDYLVAHALQTQWLVATLQRDHEAALRHIDAAVAIVRDKADLAGMHFDLLDNRLSTLQNLDRLMDADETLRSATKLVSEHQLPTGANVSAAVHHYWTGQWNDALRELQATSTELDPAMITYTDLMDSGPTGLLLHGVSALIAARRAEHTTLAAKLDAAENYSMITKPERENCDFLLAARATAAIQRGDPAAALAHLAPVLDPTYAEMMLRHQWLPDVVRLALEIGNAELAEQALAVAEMEAAREQVPARAYTALHRCTALAAGDPEPALVAVSHYRSVGRPVELASALEEAGTLLAARDLLGEATAAYREASRMFASLGADWDMARVTSRMSRLGIC
ncbi:AfsR/SARP family transcriptional regulator [Kibdelosporangium aridum]|uniref:DNA-binding transcriptional activator of the SARP family n=1 Tax=Kibdelosporangium aridum TaxID=2030 RepID=A0A1W2FMM5_KIBAR|nr:BTAD domain-containing putative transcriptional regulator [Kibdelosporangium aridum]SMD22942.1 DNA-binding transcriptional activator of the SARP family [Kibdelosporangium aridum]